jgi:hypothetical protein
MNAPGTSIAADITRSMQYMSERNGGLLIDFRPIQSYREVAAGEDHYARVRTVLDWIAFGVEVDLLQPGKWRGAFARAGDLAQFAAELRRYDAAMSEHHLRAFERLGVMPPGRPPDYRALADAIAAARALREAA